MLLISSGNGTGKGAQYDTIILDPPAFAKNKESLEARAARIQRNQQSGYAINAFRAAS